MPQLFRTVLGGDHRHAQALGDAHQPQDFGHRRRAILHDTLQPFLDIHDQQDRLLRTHAHNCRRILFVSLGCSLPQGPCAVTHG